MSKAVYFEAAKPGTVKHPLWYKLRDILRGGNPEPKEGWKRIRPEDDYGSWSNGFHPAAMPAPIKKTPGDAATSSGSRSKNARTVYHEKEWNAR